MIFPSLPLCLLSNKNVQFVFEWLTVRLLVAVAITGCLVTFTDVIPCCSHHSFVSTKNLLVGKVMETVHEKYRFKGNLDHL